MLDNFRGAILTPDSKQYQVVATAFGGLTSNPVLVVRPVAPRDVAAALAHARAERMPLSVRSGGHGAFAVDDGGLLVDLSDLEQIEMLDEDIVRVGSGALWGEVAQFLTARGLAISSGDTASVGVGGLTLGGGVGWMVRSQGLTVDNLLEAEVVLPSGAVVSANATSEPELFWALRGGNGNFGVVTSFTFKAHPLPGVVAGVVRFDPTRLEEVLKSWRDAMRAAPEVLTTTLLATSAFGPEVPAQLHVLVCFAGASQVAGMAAIDPLLAIPGLIDYQIDLRQYTEMLPDAVGPEAALTLIDYNNALVDDLDDSLIQNLSEARPEFEPGFLMIRYVRGALNRVTWDATAFAHRNAEALLIQAVFTIPGSSDGAEERIRDSWLRLGLDSTAAYGNFTMQSGAAVLERMYPPSTLSRLRDVKRRYDPGNLLAHNHNIRPE